ncbi:MAG: response regulator, partial [Anaerolineales bacterium]|nr:response regulator [Anaerolineales bacterium]
PRMRDDLRVVHRNSQYLASLINDVLDLTRVESGRLTLHRERVDVADVVERAATAVQPLLDKKGLTLDIRIPADLPRVYCDRTRIQQVVLNLISNAARFTEQGGITVEVAQQDQQAWVRVTDTGPGIAADDVERVFEPFYQSGTEWGRDKGGSGLGLSISKQFVSLHGGRMWIESQLGSGTSVFFTLPISPPMEHAAQPARQIREDWVWREPAFRTARAAADDALMRRRVIVCDETGVLYPEFARYSSEIDLVDARGLTQALEALAHAPAHALILNVANPDEVRPLVEAARREAPGMAVIGCSVPPPGKRAIEAGAQGHLTKPVTRAKLDDVLRSVGRPVRSVLVVDDDPEVLQLFDSMLHLCDETLEVLIASSGLEALDVLQRTHVDLLLLDILMPDMDGWEVLEALTGEGLGTEPVVFFVSAQDPADEPPSSPFVLAATNGGLSLSRLLRCSLEMSELLLKPEAELHPAPG